MADRLAESYRGSSDKSQPNDEMALEKYLGTWAAHPVIRNIHIYISMN